jgi:phage shock protein C
MFCPQCGEEYRERVNYCCHCGTVLPAPVSPKQRLRRSLQDKKIAGVCGGFAEHLDLDPTLVRLVWLMTAFLVGWGFIAYLIAWIVMPGEPTPLPGMASISAATPQPAPGQ